MDLPPPRPGVRAHFPIAFALLCPTLIACEVRPPGSVPAEADSESVQTAPPYEAETPEIQTVRALMDAFNAHDPDAMATLVSTEVQWLSVDGADLTVEANDRSVLVEGMRSYFASLPSARSELVSVSATGRYVTTIETAYWEDEYGTEQSQSSVAVYEVEEGFVQRVWYFPAVR